ncbi:MAG: SCP2 sterol-binding domain-containing protein [Bacillota bacterium]|nr:MAG: sterol carrier protein [Bacillota bacterium]
MSALGEIFAELQRRANANPERLQGLSAVYQFELTGEGGGTYHVRIADGQAAVVEGPAQDAGCTIQMEAADFQALVAGRLNPMTAFMTGKLKVRGDLSLAMKLQSLL